MSFNKAAAYRQMLIFLHNNGYDVTEQTNSRLASLNETTFAEMDELDLTHYATALEATYQVKNELMDGDAMAQEWNEIQSIMAYRKLAVGDLRPLEDRPKCSAGGQCLGTGEVGIGLPGGPKKRPCPACRPQDVEDDKWQRLGPGFAPDPGGAQ